MCCAPCRTTGPASPSTWTIPLTRSRSGPRSSLKARSAAFRLSHLKGVSNHRQNERIATSCATEAGATRDDVAVDRVDNGNDTVEPVLRSQQSVRSQRMQYGDGVREARGLDEHAIEVDYFAGSPLDEQLAQRLLQIGAQGATQAAVAEQGRLFGRPRYKLMIDGDVTELVDDHRGPMHRRMAHQAA